MLLTYPDVLLHLPVDATLRTYLEREGLALPADFDWTDDAGVSSRLIVAVQGAEVAVRDRIAAGLLESARLSHPAAKAALWQASAWSSPALRGLLACQSDVHRAFWLFVHHPDLFEQATELEYADRHLPQAQQHDLGTRAQVRRDEAALAAFRTAIQSFYQAELGCGEACVAQVLDRTTGTQLLIVHAKDAALLRLEFDGAQLARRIGNPHIPMLLEYSAATGVARTIIRGGAKYHAMLATAFATHLLGVAIAAQRLKPPTLDLSTLKLGFQVPQALADGFVSLQVKALTLLSADAALKSEFTALASSEHRCVTELIAANFPHDNPLAGPWMVTAASITLYYPPIPGKQRCPRVTVEVTRRGRLNLHKFDEALRAQLEGYLVSLGILQPQQTLSAQAHESGARPDLIDQRAA